MAIDWGGAASAFIDVLQGQQIGGAAQGFAPTSIPSGIPTSMPREVTVNTVTGEVKPCRRRRRRRLLTPTDLADLASLQTLVGKGSDAMKFAVTKAVRR